MRLTKVVDGVAVDCSPEEEAAIRADWAANEQKAKLPQKTPVDAILDDPAQLAALKAALAK